MNNDYDKIKLNLFFKREKEYNFQSKKRQIEVLKKFFDARLLKLKEIVDSGKTEITVFSKDLIEVTKELSAAGIIYQISQIIEVEKIEDTQNEESKEDSQEINFIVSRDILKKKRNEVVECIVISKEEYNELLKCKEITKDLIGSLRTLSKNLSTLTKDFSITLHNYIS